MERLQVLKAQGVGNFCYLLRAAGANGGLVVAFLAAWSSRDLTFYLQFVPPYLGETKGIGKNCRVYFAQDLVVQGDRQSGPPEMVGPEI